MIDIVRSRAPARIREHGKWSSECVEALQRDFHGKCYLCEAVVQSSFHVDHRVPKAEDPAQDERWENLFPACEICNTRRPKKSPVGGWLKPGDGVERRIDQWIDEDCDPAFRAANGDVAAENTAAELRSLHDGSRAPKIADRVSAIRKQLIVVRRAVAALEDAPAAERGRCEVAVRKLVSRKAPYTMLVRAEFSELAAYFD